MSYTARIKEYEVAEIIEQGSVIDRDRDCIDRYPITIKVPNVVEALRIAEECVFKLNENQPWTESEREEDGRILKIRCKTEFDFELEVPVTHPPYAIRDAVRASSTDCW